MYIMSMTLINHLKKIFAELDKKELMNDQSVPNFPLVPGSVKLDDLLLGTVTL